MEKKRILLGIVIFIFCAIVVTVVIGILFSQRLTVFGHEEGGDGLAVCALADLHFPYGGVGTEDVVNRVKQLTPDIILLCGDMLDGSGAEKDLIGLETFYDALVALAPVYAVTGNHEIGSPLLESYQNLCLRTGVNLLMNQSVLLNTRLGRVQITGLKDGSLLSEKNLGGWKKEGDVSLLIGHRPELLENYATGLGNGAPDYVFAGHTHGGSVRIFGRGMYAPNQGWFPEYSAGLYEKNRTKMFVTRGLGDGKRFFRCFNPYDFVFVRIPIENA